MKYKSLQTPEQISQALKLVLGESAYDPMFENDNFTGIEIVEPHTNCRIRITRSSAYSDSLAVMIEEPEGITPNGYRLFGKYKNKIEVNEFFESEDALRARLESLDSATTYYFDNPESLKDELNLEYHKTAVIRKDAEIVPASPPLIEVLENPVDYSDEIPF